MRRLLFSVPMRLGLLVLLGLCGAAPAASAQDIAWTTDYANLRTGPDSGYPRILTVPAGSAVEVFGCIDDWSWCDIYWRGERGWISAGLLEYEYSGNRVHVYDYGVYTGWPIVTFVFGSYWHDHYRHRHWYHDRDYWQAYRPPPRPRPAYRPSYPRPPYPSYSRPYRPLPQARPARPDDVQARPPHLADRPPVQRPSEQRPPQNRPPQERPAQQRPPQQQRPQDRQGVREQQRPPETQRPPQHRSSRPPQQDARPPARAESHPSKEHSQKAPPKRPQKDQDKRPRDDRERQDER